MSRRAAPLLLLIPLALGGGCTGSIVGPSPGLVLLAAVTTHPPPSPVVPLDSAPPAARTVSGEVFLSPDRTRITLDLDGLQPGATYGAHVHEQACADDAGGPHFKFDPAGPAEPPNEVHFQIPTGPGETDATVTQTAAQPLPDRARSVVVHDPAETKIACADLPPAR